MNPNIKLFIVKIIHLYNNYILIYIIIIRITPRIILNKNDDNTKITLINKMFLFQNLNGIRIIEKNKFN